MNITNELNKALALYTAALAVHEYNQYLHMNISNEKGQHISWIPYHITYFGKDQGAQTQNL